MAAASRADLYTFGFGPPGPASARDPGSEPGPSGAELWVTVADGPERYLVRNRALRGRHNRENAMAAVLCARLAGVPGDAIQAGLDAFPGLPHRLELVAERQGVEWVNDSKATNVDSTSVGLAAFPEGTARIVLIMGGRGKGAPYAPLKPLLEKKAKAILTIGEDAPKVAADLGPVTDCGTLANAVTTAHGLATPGDVVLLSPACASYDQFKNFEDRGDQFKALVRGLK
jgi:UDP-N-acetylmuramoylalanine--D-glutamate ligase